MASSKSSGLSSQPRVTSVAWGWRLEAGLALGCFALLKLSIPFGSGGPVLASGLLAIALASAPQLRAQISKRLASARSRRVLAAALRNCQIVGLRGTPPSVMSSEEIPAGQRFLVRLTIGMHAGTLEQHAPELAAALGAREVRVSQHAKNASFAHLYVIRTETLPRQVLSSPLMAKGQTSIWQPIDIGRDENGLPVTISLPEHNLLIGGEPGAGKSVAMANIVAAVALDPTATLTLLDGKTVELAQGEDCADRFVGPDQQEALDVLHNLQLVMDLRYAVLRSTRKRKIDPTSDQGLHVVVIDELAFYLRGGDKKVRDEFADNLRDLVSRGRAAGMIVIAATQKPSHDIVPTWIRDLFSYRLAMRCTSPEASDTILGQGWASQGFSSSSIDPANRGVGYLLAEGGLPIKFKAAYLSDDDIEELAVRAAGVRSHW